MHNIFDFRCRQQLWRRHICCESKRLCQYEYFFVISSRFGPKPVRPQSIQPQFFIIINMRQATCLKDEVLKFQQYNDRTRYYLLFWMNFVTDLLWLFRSFYLRRSSVESFVERDLARNDRWFAHLHIQNGGSKKIWILTYSWTVCSSLQQYNIFSFI